MSVKDWRFVPSWSYFTYEQDHDLELTGATEISGNHFTVEMLPLIVPIHRLQNVSKYWVRGWSYVSPLFLRCICAKPYNKIHTQHQHKTKYLNDQALNKKNIHTPQLSYIGITSPWHILCVKWDDIISACSGSEFSSSEEKFPIFTNRFPCILNKLTIIHIWTLGQCSLRCMPFCFSSHWKCTNADLNPFFLLMTINKGNLLPQNKCQVYTQGLPHAIFWLSKGEVHHPATNCLTQGYPHCPRSNVSI